MFIKRIVVLLTKNLTSLRQLDDIVYMTYLYIRLPRKLSPILSFLLNKAMPFSFNGIWNSDELFLWVDFLSSIDALLGHPTCLKRSVLLYLLLINSKVLNMDGLAISKDQKAVELYIGESINKPGEGHAWVAINGVLDLSPGVDKQYKIIAKFSNF